MAKNWIEAVLSYDEFIGHVGVGRVAPIESEVTRSAQSIHLAHTAGEYGLATIDDVAKAIVAAPGIAAKNGVFVVDGMVDLQRLIVLAFGSLRGKIVAGGVQSVANGKIIGQRGALQQTCNCWI